MKTIYNKKLCNNVKAMREEMGVKQKGLAEKIGMTQGKISEIEKKGLMDIGNITLNTAFLIADALGKTIDEVFVMNCELVESTFKYGIFKASCELREYESEWNFVWADEDIPMPLEIFESEKTAIEALKNYKAEKYKYRSNGGYYFYQATVYFVATLEIVDRECLDDDLAAYCYGDGVAITSFDDTE